MQVVVAVQPARVPLPSLTKAKVRHPLALLEVKGPGRALERSPDHPPAPYVVLPLPAPAVLANFGAFTSGPLKMKSLSQLASVLKLLKSTRTWSPGVVRQ